MTKRGRTLARLCVVALAFASALSATALARADGTLRVVTYNVAGLPEGMSRAHPLTNLPLIGAGLNRYDLALVQEDFAYPSLLRRLLRLPHQSKPFVRGERYHLGDGLSVFSSLPFGEPSRTPWATCHGVTDSFFDCLTPKGLLRVTVELAPAVSLDVYDVHMDAGWSELDRRARVSQLEQLARAIDEHSRDRAVLVAGDFNLSAGELDALERLERDVGVRDACRTLSCRDPRRIDRVLFRSSPELVLVAQRWRVDAGFVDARGRPLSDHSAVAVTFRWQAVRPAHDRTVRPRPEISR